jgi:hypothetical protein
MIDSDGGKSTLIVRIFAQNCEPGDKAPAAAAGFHSMAQKKPRHDRGI